MGRPVVGVKLRQDEQRFDIGNFETYFTAFIEFALDDPEYGYLVRQFLRRKLKEV